MQAITDENEIAEVDAQLEAVEGDKQVVTVLDLDNNRAFARWGNTPSGGVKTTVRAIFDFDPDDEYLVKLAIDQAKIKVQKIVGEGVTAGNDVFRISVNRETLEPGRGETTRVPSLAWMLKTGQAIAAGTATEEDMQKFEENKPILDALKAL